MERAGIVDIPHRQTQPPVGGSARRVLRMAGMVMGALLYRPAEAHEKWFLDPGAHPLDVGAALQDALTWVAIVVPVVLWGVAAVLWRWRNHRSFVPSPSDLGGRPEARDALYAFIPLVLAVHLAVPLLINGMNHTLFGPTNALEGIWAHLFTLGQIGVALGLFYGTPTRLCAVLLAVMWGIGLFVVGVEPMLETVHILGFGVFFFCAGRGPAAVDRVLFPRWEPPPALVAWAVPILRVGIGLSLIVVAFTEKLLNVPMGVAFLAQYPLNVLPSFGIPITDTQFVLMAGSVELLVGLCVVSGVFLRDIIVIAWLPFNLTLGIFGPEELVGHLPFYGAMALFFLWGATHQENLEAWERGILRPSLGALLR
jgi:hypothetical protein